jgi:hypothetical protein
VWCAEAAASLFLQQALGLPPGALMPGGGATFPGMGFPPNSGGAMPLAPPAPAPVPPINSTVSFPAQMPQMPQMPLSAAPLTVPLTAAGAGVEAGAGAAAAAGAVPDGSIAARVSRRRESRRRSDDDEWQLNPGKADDASDYDEAEGEADADRAEDEFGEGEEDEDEEHAAGAAGHKPNQPRPRGRPRRLDRTYRRKDEPKRPESAYFWFHKEQRYVCFPLRLASACSFVVRSVFQVVTFHACSPLVTAANPHLDFNRIGALCAAKWDSLTAQEKQQYVVKAEADQERYAKEYKAYAAHMAALGTPVPTTPPTNHMVPTYVSAVAF